MKSRQVFITFIVAAVVSILFLTVMFNQRSYLRHRQISKQSVVGAVKQVYTTQRAVPNKYSDMQTMITEFKKSQDWSTLVDMGDEYARGFFPYLLPNEKVARICYEVATKCPNSVVRGNAQAKMTALVEYPISEQDQLGHAMDTTYGNSLVKLANSAMSTKKNTKSTKKDTKITKKDTKTTKTNKPTELELRNSKMRREMNMKRIKKPRTAARRQEPTRRRHRLGGGSQNTHDHGVTSATKTNIKTLVDEFRVSGRSFRDHEEVFDEAIKLCKDSGISKEEVADAHHVIVSLSPDEYSGTGVSQIQILDMVLWKISTIPDPNIESNVRETLGKRLSSGFENGIVVCGTGKVSRIISVFEGVLDNAQKGVSINIVEKEIAQLAAKIRHDFLESVGPTGRKAYQTANSVPEYSKAMSDILLVKVREEYVEKLNMKDSVINPLVKTYAEAY